MARRREVWYWQRVNNVDRENARYQILMIPCIHTDTLIDLSTSVMVLDLNVGLVRCVGGIVNLKYLREVPIG
jgi:hypothetical protein